MYNMHSRLALLLFCKGNFLRTIPQHFLDGSLLDAISRKVSLKLLQYELLINISLSFKNFLNQFDGDNIGVTQNYTVRIISDI